MSNIYLKQAQKNPQTNSDETRKITMEMLDNIRVNGEQAALDYGKKLDKWEGEIVLDEQAIERAKQQVPQQLKDDIRFAYDRVRAFAQKQRDSIVEFETELSPGLWAGQKLIPMDTAGCYVPGGRYAHVASAVMSIATAKVAGVKNVIACSAPHAQYQGPHPAIVYTMDMAGADYILAMGGVQAIAAMRYGLFTGHKANILVGPGNRFVAEAKRLLYGQTGIDLFAGPTEIAIIADETADPDMVACDLVGQAEHGPDSPAWLITTSKKLGQAVINKMDDYINALPNVQKEAATAAWRDYGEVVLCDSKEEAAQKSDEYAPEHLEIQTQHDDWYVEHLTSYGSLFIGEETTVAFGDKCSGTNHILPTKGAAHYTGGLSVHKFLKVVTTQRMTKEANRDVAAVTARISRLEGMEAHARTGDQRLQKYFPNEEFLLDGGFGQ